MTNHNLIKNTTMQKGRSMVEMLGVLAIIGVLSIGGIAGYTMAMNRYRANEIIDAASKIVVIAQTSENKMADLNDIEINGKVGGCAVRISAFSTTDGRGDMVSVSGCNPYPSIMDAVNSILGDTLDIGGYHLMFDGSSGGGGQN